MRCYTKVKVLYTAFIGVTLLTVLNTQAEAVVLDFEDMPTSSVLSSYQEDGFKISTQNGSGLVPVTTGPDGVSIVQNSGFDAILIEHVLSETFGLSSVDLSANSTLTIPGLDTSAVITGLKEDGSIVTTTLSSDQISRANAVTFQFGDDFSSDLTQLSFTRADGSFQTPHFDNVVLNTVIPTPSTVAITALGLAFLASRRTK